MAVESPPSRCAHAAKLPRPTRSSTRSSPSRGVSAPRERSVSRCAPARCWLAVTQSSAGSTSRAGTRRQSCPARARARRDRSRRRHAPSRPPRQSTRNARDRTRRGRSLRRPPTRRPRARRAPRRRGAPRRQRLMGPDALTASERRVAELAALGLTNRQIAQALFVTTKTVEMHLGHVYPKLGITGRGEIAAALGGPRPPVKGARPRRLTDSLIQIPPRALKRARPVDANTGEGTPLPRCTKGRRVGETPNTPPKEPAMAQLASRGARPRSRPRHRPGFRRVRGWPGLNGRRRRSRRIRGPRTSGRSRATAPRRS